MVEAFVLTRKLPVHRSAPVRTTMHKPYVKTSADKVRMRPGAFSWYQGDAFVESAVAQANDKRQPADTELKKTLSRRVFPLVIPVRDTVSMVSAGVNALYPIWYASKGRCVWEEKEKQCGWSVYEVNNHGRH